MSVVKQVINKEYNQFKQDLTKRVWDKLDESIEEINQNVEDKVSIFGVKSE